MNQKTAAEKPPQTKHSWVLFGCVLLLSALCVVSSLKGSGPRNSVSLQGTIVILDENGDVVPYRDTTFTFYSHYPGGFFRSEMSRKRNLYIDEEGFGNRVPILIPRYPATLFFHTLNGKYATVVDIAEGEPTTGLAVTLRPRHSATGRLVNHSGMPLANFEFTLNLQRTPSFAFGQNTVSVETLEFVYGETDADGYFTVDRLIPGVEYSLRIHVPRTAGGHATVTMPILEPEQYQEPFDLGDVPIHPPILRFSPSGSRCC